MDPVAALIANLTNAQRLDFVDAIGYKIPDVLESVPLYIRIYRTAADQFRYLRLATIVFGFCFGAKIFIATELMGEKFEHDLFSYAVVGSATFFLGLDAKDCIRYFWHRMYTLLN